MIFLTTLSIYRSRDWMYPKCSDFDQSHDGPISITRAVFRQALTNHIRSFSELIWYFKRLISKKKTASTTAFTVSTPESLCYSYPDPTYKGVEVSSKGVNPSNLKRICQKYVTLRLTTGTQQLRVRAQFQLNSNRIPTYLISQIIGWYFTDITYCNVHTQRWVYPDQNFKT